jgi:hypothetical protein
MPLNQATKAVPDLRASFTARSLTGQNATTQTIATGMATGLTIQCDVESATPTHAEFETDLLLNAMVPLT